MDWLLDIAGVNASTPAGEAEALVWKTALQLHTGGMHPTATEMLALEKHSRDLWCAAGYWLRYFRMLEDALPENKRRVRALAQVESPEAAIDLAARMDLLKELGEGN